MTAETTDTENGKTTAKQQIALWTVAIPALVGLVAGVVSGGLTSYVQLSTKQEEYSIQRAKLFRELMGELLDDKKSRLAVLNLWQLYPKERDRRVITAAAFAVNQPDLVELVAGIDEKVNPVADMLHVRALSTDPEIRTPALRTLINIDPVRAAGLLIETLNEELGLNEGKMLRPQGGFNAMKELERLAAMNDTIAQMVADEANGKWGLFYDYLLYRADRASDFVEKILAAYKTGEGLDLTNDYLYRAQFHQAHRATVIVGASAYIAAELKTVEPDEFDLAGALSALKNGDFFGLLGQSFDEDFTRTLRAAAEAEAHVDILRQRALELLDRFSPRDAVITYVGIRIADGTSAKLISLSQKYLSDHKFAGIKVQHPDFAPPVCEGMKADICIEKSPENWRDWLQQLG